MATKILVINLTLQETTAAIVSKMAKKQKKSISALAKELILEALEKREDIALSDIANARDTKNAKRIAHDEVWK